MLQNDSGTKVNDDITSKLQTRPSDESSTAGVKSEDLVGGKTGKQTFEALRSDINDLQKKLQDIEKSKFDIITLIGLFVGLITYLGLEIQIFKIIDNSFSIVGISMFFIASLLLFMLTMNSIIKNQVEDVKFVSSKIYTILTLLLVGSIFFIVLGSRYPY